VVQARAEEICQMVLTEIRRAGFDRSLNSGVVLTGGGAILEGMPEIAEQIFDMPVRRGTPSGIGGLVDVVASPVYSTAVGLVLCGYRSRAGHGIGTARPAATGTFGKVTGRLMSWLSDFF
jgi:cell division protein FtsA